jgi:hypothetical protein
MAYISQKDAYEIFKDVTTVDDLQNLIKKHSHLWWDEDITLQTLNKCIDNGMTQFSTVLLSDDGPFLLWFSVQDKEIRLENLIH